MLVRRRPGGGEAAIVNMIGLRGLSISLLVLRVIEHQGIDRWLRMLVLWWTRVPKRVRWVELWSRSWVETRAITILMLPILNPMAEGTPASASTVVT